MVAPAMEKNDLEMTVEVNKLTGTAVLDRKYHAVVNNVHDRRFDVHFVVGLKMTFDMIE